jgi:hypothetical protein
MSVNLKNAMHAAALAESLGDTEARASGVLSNTRPTTSRIRRRRAARQAGTSVVGAAAVAAIVVGGSAVKSHNTAAGPSTALSERAGVQCGKPFDPTGKSDPRFTVSEVQSGGAWRGVSLPFAYQVFEGNQTLEGTEQESVSPTTAVILERGVVVGITEPTSSWGAFHPGLSQPPVDQTEWPDPWHYVSIAQTMNCIGTTPAHVTQDMFEVVFLSDYRVPGTSRTALVVTNPAKGPHESNLTQPLAPTDYIFWPIDWANPGGGTAAVKWADYAAARDKPGATVPLYVVPTNYVAPGTAPYAGAGEAHITADGTLQITLNGSVIATLTKADTQQ